MELAEILRNSFLVLHFVGIAALLGGFLTQMKAMGQKAAQIVPAMVHGAWTMLITGLALVGIAEWRIAMGAEFEVDNIKVGVKLLVLLAVLVMVLVFRKKQSVKPAIFGAIGGLTLLNIVLAVFW